MMTQAEKALIKALSIERRRAAQLRANNKYAAREMRVISAKVRAPMAAQFADICRRAKLSKHAAIKAYIEQCNAARRLICPPKKLQSSVEKSEKRLKTTL